jgi:hypothetical protein
VCVDGGACRELELELELESLPTVGWPGRALLAVTNGSLQKSIKALVDRSINQIVIGIRSQKLEYEVTAQGLSASLGGLTAPSSQSSQSGTAFPLPGLGWSRGAGILMASQYWYYYARESSWDRMKTQLEVMNTRAHAF